MNQLRRKWMLAPAAFLLCRQRIAQAQTSDLTAANVVPITLNLYTSGQPTATSLATLGALGFQSVINLALTTSRDAVAEEAVILQRQGIEYVHLPIEFSNPTAEDFDRFAAALSRLRDRKVLVHCQVNLRASSFVFLYRVIVLKEPAESAYEAVAKVWSPREPWKSLLITLLRKHQIAFEPY